MVAVPVDKVFPRSGSQPMEVDLHGNSLGDDGVELAAQVDDRDAVKPLLRFYELLRGKRRARW